MNEPELLSGIKKIAVLRANGLGDFIFSLPALNALRQTYPEAEIVYLGLSWHKSFMEGRPGPVDRVIVIPKYNGIPHEKDRVEDDKAIECFFSAMQDEQFDIAFQLHGGGAHSNPFIRKLGAGLTVGLQAPGALPLDRNVPYYLPQNEILRYLEVVACAGAKMAGLEPRLQLREEDTKECLALRGTIGTPYAVLHPGVSNIHRRWAPGNFSKVGDVLAEEGLEIFITGSGNETSLAREVAGNMRYKVRDVSGKLSIGGLAALISEAEVIISNDTGPLHLARAVRTPNVGIFWAVNAITAGTVTNAWNRLCIAWNPYCPACGKDCLRGNVHDATGGCRHEVSLVNEITTGEVIAHALDLLTMKKKLHAAADGKGGPLAPVLPGNNLFHNGYKK